MARTSTLWTSAAVVAQVWRDGARQVWLAKTLGGIGVRALGHDDRRRAGELLRAARTADVIVAHLALVVEEGDRVLTSDPEEIEHLLESRRVDAIVTPT